MSDLLVEKIEEIAEFAGLEPETLLLIQLAAEAQRTGKMPDLQKLQTYQNERNSNTPGK